MSKSVMLGPCAKVTVTCTIKNNGKTFYGENWCHNPQKVCPREPGEDYTKCHTLCQTVGHAEMVALAAAGLEAVGASVLIHKHKAATCLHCEMMLAAAGVINVDVRESETVSTHKPFDLTPEQIAYLSTCTYRHKYLQIPGPAPDQCKICDGLKELGLIFYQCTPVGDGSGYFRFPYRISYQGEEFLKILGVEEKT